MRRLLVAFLAASALLGCGGGGPTGGPAADPVTAVTNVVNAIKAKSFQILPSMYCEGRNPPFTSSLNSLASQVPGMTVDSIMAPVTITVDGFTATLFNQNGNQANVQVTGTMTFTVDPVRARDVVRAVLAAQGQPTDEASITTGVGQYSQGWVGQHAISSVGAIRTTKSDTGWVVCDVILDT
jgi:hypothetical protein